MFVLEKLNPASGESYGGFTFPYFRELLKRAAGSVVAVGATLQGRPVGLALAEVSGEWARLHSVAVAPSCRRLGLGAALLSQTERELGGRGCRTVEGVYMTGRESGATEGLLRKMGWSSPRTRRVIGAADLARCGQVPWIFGTGFPSRFSVRSWTDVSAEERGALAKLGPPSLHPVPQETVEENVSLALYDRGEAAGWVIWTVVDGTRLRCARLFVRGDLQRMGRGVGLLARSIERAWAAGWREALFDVEIENRAMARFVGRRMKGYLTSLRESRGSFKVLG